MRRPLHRLITDAAFAAPMLTSVIAYAGEIKFGAQELAVDDKGVITAEGKKAAVSELDNIPGEDAWQAFVWAKLDNAGEGPLYFEFYQEINGQNSLVFRHEENGFDGAKYFSGEIELQGRIGFNKDRTYTVRAIQVSAKGKDLELAKGKIKLIKSGKEPPPEEKDDEDDELADQDEHDSLGGDEEEPSTPPPTEAPPPVEPKKKGCSIDSDAFGGFNGALVLFGIAGGLLYRRRR